MGSRHDPNRRPTKAERKEQARLERERIQREMAARSRNRRIGLVLVGVAAIGGIGAAVLAATSSANLPDPQELLRRADRASQQAGCGEVENPGFYGGIEPQSPAYQDQSHIGPTGAFPAMPPVSSYPSVPPASGPHNPTPLGAGTYADPPQLDRVIHSLEHGAAVIWYDPDAPGAVIDRIVAFYDGVSNVGTRVIVAPYDYPGQGEAGRLPAGTQMALVAWHRVRSCAQPNLAAAFGFTSQFAFPTFDDRPYRGEAPEAGGAI